MLLEDAANPQCADWYPEPRSGRRSRPPNSWQRRNRGPGGQIPQLKLFEEQTPEYKASVLPAGVPKLAIEARRYARVVEVRGQDGDVIGIDRFGASAPGPKVLAELVSPRKTWLRG